MKVCNIKIQTKLHTVFTYEATIGQNGNITLTKCDKKNGELCTIFFLSKKESDAIFDLMNEIHEKTDKNDMTQLDNAEV